MEVGVRQGSVLSLFLIATAIDVVTEEIKKELFHEILYANNLVSYEQFYRRHSKKICK